jgi:hypothetical protein
MTDTIDLNPFSMTYDALITLLRRHPDFRIASDNAGTDFVKQKNQIFYNHAQDNLDPAKDQIQVADTPEIMLLTGGVQNSTLQRDSSASQFIRQYSWVVTTGNHRLQPYLNHVGWSICCAMVGWQTTLTELRWPNNANYAFIKKLDLISSLDGLADGTNSRNLRGWVSVWTINVEMWIKTADMLAQLTP